MHGHQVGGTNPSLVEALGAGNSVIAHNNRFNRWVLGDDHFFFKSDDSLRHILNQVCNDECKDSLIKAQNSARKRFDEIFQWDQILEQYESVLVSLKE